MYFRPESPGELVPIGVWVLVLVLLVLLILLPARLVKHSLPLRGIKLSDFAPKHYKAGLVGTWGYSGGLLG